MECFHALGAGKEKALKQVSKGAWLVKVMCLCQSLGPVVGMKPIKTEGIFKLKRSE
jgi:hypothetical protein